MYVSIHIYLNESSFFPFMSRVETRHGSIASRILLYVSGCIRAMVRSIALASKLRTPNQDVPARSLGTIRGRNPLAYR
jgi:hypothetical protein